MIMTSSFTKLVRGVRELVWITFLAVCIWKLVSSPSFNDGLIAVKHIISKVEKKW